jgi:thymidine phosphorylase
MAETELKHAQMIMPMPLRKMRREPSALTHKHMTTCAHMMAMSQHAATSLTQLHILYWSGDQAIHHFEDLLEAWGCDVRASAVENLFTLNVSAYEEDVEQVLQCVAHLLYKAPAQSVMHAVDNAASLRLYVPHKCGCT